MEWKMILLCVIAFIITTRLSGAKPRPKLRGNNQVLRRYKVTSRDCDQHAPPTYRRLALLWSKVGFHLAVLSNGTLHGVNSSYCRQTRRCLFELQACSTSVIRIKHVQSGLYVAINKAGRIYTTLKSHKPDTMLVQEILSNGFTVFWSERTYRKSKAMMFLALKKNGAAKNASKPILKHKSVQFTVCFVKDKKNILHFMERCL
ncbi:hypothetical protein ACROYT_G034637 [Oculina patagonica]